MRGRQGSGKGPGDRGRGPGGGPGDRRPGSGGPGGGHRPFRPGSEDRPPPRRAEGGRSEQRGPDRPRADRPGSDRPRRDGGSGGWEPQRRGPRRSEAFEHARKVLDGKAPAAPAKAAKPFPPAAPNLPELPPSPPPPGARLADVGELEVEIEKLVAGGDGITRFEGVPIFVARSAPGDRLRIRLVERRADYGRAEIVEILKPGPDRRPDPVPELSRTGICDLQHLTDEAQPRLKAQAVRETLQHLGQVTVPPDAPVITGAPWGYRLRTQLHTEIDPVAGGVRVGYHARGTNDLIALSRCPLLVPELEALLGELPALLGREAPRRLDLAAGDQGAVTASPTVAGLPQGEISTQVGEFTYFYDARCFFQGHRGLLPKLVELTVGDWEGETAVDLFSGVGLFSFPLARRYRKVTAVEGDQTSSRYARLNVRRNKVENLETVNQAVETWLVDKLPTGLDRLVVDPPRTGLSVKVRTILLDRRPARITYVSCHPAALARDLRQLQKGYTVESVVFFDLFPQTGHMETVVQLVRKEEPREDGLASATSPSGSLS